MAKVDQKQSVCGVLLNAARFLLLAVATLMLTVGAEGQDRGQTRSMVISKGGIVASESPLASQAGVRILENGGNAVDAAIAANAMMGVVEPMMNGIGGDLFVIVYDAKANKLYGLNASGWAPKGLTIEFLHKQGLRDMPQTGVHSITVPGVVDGWQKLADRFGRRKLKEDLAAAIRTAQDGFPVPEWDAAYWATEVDLLRTDDAATSLYLPGDHAPKVGEVFRNPDLAASLGQIAERGRDAFYKGEISKKILDAMKRHNGTMTDKDLAEYSSEWVEPISTTYRDWTVYEMPPNGQGMAALEMLNIMETVSLGQKDTGFGSTKALHTMIEAKKLAYADVARYLADPRGQKIPVATLVSKPWAVERAKLIDPEKAACEIAAGEIAGGSDTTYLSVVDRDGNMVSLIQSNYAAFGSGIVPARAGFVMHNRGGLFTLDPSSPNALAGHKRPRHTIIPGFAEKGDTRMAFGIMGGWNQAQAHAQFMANIADFKMNIQAAMEAARFTKYTFTGCDVEMENRFSGKVRDELTAKGHQIKVLGTFSSRVGGGQVVLRDFATGVNYGASDPRKDGQAAVELPAP
ncbi:MAG TPA: gamma-glutamyltransferase [Candidatus Cybelea sp.]|jgi:gamma-glutamyltranspeptidase/glutathione hydrolase|nr:gamma-glutamyltransferase [Candidatus Cybelea sp.]